MLYTEPSEYHRPVRTDTYPIDREVYAMFIMRLVMICYCCVALASCATEQLGYNPTAAGSFRFPQGQGIEVTKADAEALIGKWVGHWYNAGHNYPGGKRTTLVLSDAKGADLYEPGQLLLQTVYRAPRVSETRYKTRAVVVGGKLYAYGDRDTLDLIQTSPHCLALLYKTTTDAGHAFRAYWQRCDDPRGEPLIATLIRKHAADNAIAERPAPDDEKLIQQ